MPKVALGAYRSITIRKETALRLSPREESPFVLPRGTLDATHLYSSDFVTRMSRWLTKTEDGWIMGEPKGLGTKKIKGREAIGYRVSRETFEYGQGTGPSRLAGRPTCG